MSQTKEELFIETMQKEIRLMREILSSLLQEEVLLLKQDQATWRHLMQERFTMIQMMSALRKERQDYSLNLSTESSHSCEIILLVEQLTSLLDKTNKQNSRNQNLLDQTQHLIAIAKTFPYPHSPKPAVEQKPLLLMTLVDESK